MEEVRGLACTFCRKCYLPPRVFGLETTAEAVVIWDGGEAETCELGFCHFSPES